MQASSLHRNFTDYLMSLSYNILPVPSVVKMLKDLCPEALFMVDSNGDLPLNIAIKRGSKEVSDALQWTIDLERQDEAVSNMYTVCYG